LFGNFEEKYDGGHSKECKIKRKEKIGENKTKQINPIREMGVYCGEARIGKNKPRKYKNEEFDSKKEQKEKENKDCGFSDSLLIKQGTCVE
jgi:hypothetical protein